MTSRLKKRVIVNCKNLDVWLTGDKVEYWNNGAKAYG